MPEQSLLKIVKRWRRYEPRGEWSVIPPKTRGFYVLYQKRRTSVARYDVVYIGVAGLGKGVKRGIRGRLKRHHKRREGWSHFSFFEVHDNVTREDMRELESLLLSIFRHDSRVRLQNVQKSSRILYKLGQQSMWPDRKSEGQAVAAADGARLRRRISFTTVRAARRS